MTNPDNVGGLPELPEPVATITGTYGHRTMALCDPVRAPIGSKLYTADQMRAYGELCRAAPAGGDVKPSEPQPPPGHRWIDPEIDMLTVEEARRLRREP